jgi:hypothetical protein
LINHIFVSSVPHLIFEEESVNENGKKSGSQSGNRNGSRNGKKAKNQ